MTNIQIQVRYEMYYKISWHHEDHDKIPLLDLGFYFFKHLTFISKKKKKDQENSAIQ